MFHRLDHSTNTKVSVIRFEIIQWQVSFPHILSLVQTTFWSGPVFYPWRDNEKKNTYVTSSFIGWDFA